VLPIGNILLLKPHELRLCGRCWPVGKFAVYAMLLQKVCHTCHTDWQRDGSKIFSPYVPLDYDPLNL
jgi:hypothetical protein